MCKFKKSNFNCSQNNFDAFSWGIEQNINSEKKEQNKRNNIRTSKPDTFQSECEKQLKAQKNKCFRFISMKNVISDISKRINNKIRIRLKKEAAQQNKVVCWKN